MRANPILDHCKLVAIELILATIASEATTTEVTSPITVKLGATPYVGVFTCNGWETTPLASLVQSKGFSLEPLETPCNGTIIGLKINIPKILTMVTDESERESFISLAKHICINRQSELTPALAYATEIDPAYTPTKGDFCKTCTFKRRCHFYRLG